MQDRFTSGFTAGIIGMLAATIPDVSAYALGISASRYLDVAGILLWGDAPHATWEAVFGWLATLGFCGLLGVVFVYLLPYLGSEHAMFKGIVYGIASWFMIHTVGALYKVPLLAKSTPYTLVTHLITATVYGAVLGYFLLWADQRVGAMGKKRNGGTKFSTPSPAYKLYDELPQEKSDKPEEK